MRQTLESQASQTGQAEPTWRPECRFVPLRAADLRRMLTEDAEQFGQTPEALSEVLHAIQRAIEHESCALQSELEETYAQFNPDRETQRLPGDDQENAPEDYAALHDQIAYLLDKANYEQLDDVQIAETIRRANSNRIQVRIHADRVERLELWVRGHGTSASKRRTLRCPIKGEQYESPIFKRMVVVARLKGDPHVIIKLFKDIPESEVEALLPHAEAAMTLLDRVKLFGASAGAVGTMAIKLAKVALALAMLSKILWIVLVGVGTIALRTFFGYKNAKTSRNWRRTQRLYFQNLGNNASALQLLIASVKQEEIKEACLAYCFALRASKDPHSKNGLRRKIESYLLEKLEAEVDFDIDDAVETITRLDLWRASGAQRVRAPADSLRYLQAYLCREGTSQYHLFGMNRAPLLATLGDN